ncbi:MAG TPA: SDR family oxidoreductase [Trebonia sp.]|jgi:NAD(P)-dependent dehydrogenase (short-subunit alcohol dehydrogenase family)
MKSHDALAASPCASVVVITSTSGHLGFRNSSAYAMSKIALTGLVRSLAVEWAGHPVRVSAVAPAIVPTAMNAEVRKQAGYLDKKLEGIPLGRVIEASEVAGAVAFLAGPRSSGITGATLNVDGGAIVMG